MKLTMSLRTHDEGLWRRLGPVHENMSKRYAQVPRVPFRLGVHVEQVEKVD